MKKIAYHILRYIYLVFGLIPIVGFLFFIYLSHTCPKDYSNTGILWLRGADSLLSFNVISAIVLGLFLGISAFMIFLGKSRWLYPFVFACILFLSRMVYGFCYATWSWEHIGRAIIVYSLISIIAIIHIIKNYKQKKKDSPELYKTNKMKKTFTWGLLFLLSSLVFSYIMTIHRELFFRPQYYGGWSKSFFITFDFDFFKAYLSDPLGLFLFVATLSCFAGGCLMLWGTIFIEDFSSKINKFFSLKTKIGKHRKHILRISGTLLIFIGIGIAFFWYFWLFPMSQRNDYRWHENFSKKSYWNHIQNYIHRFGWTHDDFHEFGHYGDKFWAKWIMAHALEDSWLYGCGNNGHKNAAMNYITNQSPVNDREYQPSLHGYQYREKKWVEWWRKNKNKSQIEWIQEGFAKQGVKVSKTPSVEEYKALLIILGNVREEKDYSSEDNDTADKNTPFLFPEKVEKEKEYAPDYLRYNAFRWLRDSGFEPVDFTIKHVTKSTSKEIVQGLKEYQSWNSLYPWHAEVGILPLPNRKKFQDDDGDYPRPAFFRTWIQVSGHCLIILLTISGVFLLFWSSRKKKEAK